MFQVSPDILSVCHVATYNMVCLCLCLCQPGSHHNILQYYVCVFVKAMLLVGVVNVLYFSC